jgi:hypothetical protein
VDVGSNRLWVTCNTDFWMPPRPGDVWIRKMKRFCQLLGSLDMHRDLVAVDNFRKPIYINIAARSCIARNMEINATEGRHLRLKYVRLHSMESVRARRLIRSCCIIAKVSSWRSITNRISVGVSGRE